MTEENNLEELSEEEHSSETFITIYPHVQGVILNLGDDNTMVLSHDDAWRIIGRLVSAATIHQIEALEGERRNVEQRERVRRLIESGSNIGDKKDE